MDVSTTTPSTTPRKRSRWSPHFPHDGYRLVSVRDLGAAAGDCAMCSQIDVRYLHKIIHDVTGCELEVGRCCSQQLTNDVDGPIAAEKETKRLSAIRSSWPTSWRPAYDDERWSYLDPYPPRFTLRKAGWRITAARYTLDYSLATELQPDMPTPWLLRFYRNPGALCQAYHLDEQFATFEDAAKRAFEVAFVDSSALKSGGPPYDLLPFEEFGTAAGQYWAGRDDGRRGQGPHEQGLTGHRLRRYRIGYADGVAAAEAQELERKGGVARG